DGASRGPQVPDDVRGPDLRHPDSGKLLLLVRLAAVACGGARLPTADRRARTRPPPGPELCSAPQEPQDRVRDPAHPRRAPPDRRSRLTGLRDDSAPRAVRAVHLDGGDHGAALAASLGGRAAGRQPVRTLSADWVIPVEGPPI